MLEVVTTVYTAILSVPLSHLLVEGVLALWIIWLLFRKSYRLSDIGELTEKEKEDLIAEWEPEPLVPEYDKNHPALHPTYIDGKIGKYVTMNGRECLNLATMNFLNLVGDERIEREAIRAIGTYGVGSCGPRTFYGTVDVHVQFEEAVSEFMHTEESALYSYAFATMSSAIPAYAKRGDVIFCDKMVNFAIQRGLIASRSRVEFFEHNNMEDLERLLKIQADLDKRNPRKAKVTRRFVVVEGLYINTGEICPVPKLIELKYKYKVRIFMDESCSFGVLGELGHGVTEYFNINVDDIDMIGASLENALASTGGFTTGRSYITSFQRLNATGFLFSASVPPLLAVAAHEGLKIMQQEPERFERLRRNSHTMLEGLRACRCLSVQGVDGSPLFHVRFRNVTNAQRQSEMLERVVMKCRQRGTILTQARYLADDELFPPVPSIRVAINCDLTEQEIQDAVRLIDLVSQEIAISS